ncbi:MAG: hypothetical protein LBI95_03135, partial [Holosporales bacterium]|nr:hypothetical protein [Holosporales bacterium]
MPDNSFGVEGQNIIVANIGNLEKCISDFRKKYPQLNYGVHSIESLYDIQNPEIFHNKTSWSSFFAPIVFASELITSASCEIVKCLSIFHSGVSGYGKALMGLYIGKALFWGLNSLINSSIHRSLSNTINAFQALPESASNLHNLSTHIDKCDLEPLARTASSIVEFASELSLKGGDEQKVNRLTYILASITKSNKIKKSLITVGGVLSFLTEIATGITVAVTGQRSPPSYWLTLMAGGFDAIMN